MSLTMSRTTSSKAMLWSAIAVSNGCWSPVANAASAHTGHHTCWHLPVPTPAPAVSAAAARTAGSMPSRIV
ncbi:hypothetical protein MYSE111917_24610 [Mycobacterium senriense]